ncbi:MAG: hypothetical protein ACPGRX_06615, partial [Bdellovibrionales bacterium]
PRREPMLKLSLIVFIMAAPTLMGALVLIVLTVPSLVANDIGLILPAAALGFVGALPLSYLIAKKLDNTFKKSA